jgi:hypothetical protein
MRSLDLRRQDLIQEEDMTRGQNRGREIHLEGVEGRGHRDVSHIIDLRRGDLIQEEDMAQCRNRAREIHLEEVEGRDRREVGPIMDLHHRGMSLLAVLEEMNIIRATASHLNRAREYTRISGRSIPLAKTSRLAVSGKRL